MKKSSTAANVAITLQRRYMNMVVDSSRQKQFEMFLGLRRHKHLPTQPDSPLEALTRPHACILKPVPAVYPSLFPAQALLTGLPKGASWVCCLTFLFLMLGGCSFSFSPCLRDVYLQCCIHACVGAIADETAVSMILRGHASCASLSASYLLLSVNQIPLDPKVRENLQSCAFSGLLHVGLPCRKLPLLPTTSLSLEDSLRISYVSLKLFLTQTVSISCRSAPPPRRYSKCTCSSRSRATCHSS